MTLDLLSQLQAALADRYTIERELGRGGMATVYLAQDLRHDRPVALKVLHPDLAATLGPDRFLREIKLCARLQHPHILTVHDSGTVAAPGKGPDLLWFSMPFIEGESLRDRLRRQKQLPVEDALRIGRETADALDYAHRHGVIHRDIKPENILLTEGHALVADFGIGKALSTRDDEARLTETGLAVGTPAYMSPEQAAGERELDAGTDIYSLGAVLYEMLAGEPPFTGPTAQAVIAKRLSEPPPSVRRARPAVPEAVDATLQRALAPVRADRFASAAELGAALHSTPTLSGTAPTRTGAPPGARPPSPRRIPVAALAMILGLLIGAGALFAWRRSHTETTSGNERRIAVLPFQNLGDSTEEYFAEGITDAVRGKLTALPGMRVIASNSSAQYRSTKKSPQEIGRELGVEYLLIGKVRWQKGGPGASRVQVSPELIEVATADARWQQPFDASLTDVFQVQADIAGRVAQALDVAIGSRQQQVLEARPTQNLAAYDAFLKGKALRALGTNPSSIRQAVASFEQAVALDSSFVAAWANLSVSNSILYSNGAPSPVTADRARTAAERALALDPEYPGGYWALGGYYRLVTVEVQRAAEQYRKGLALSSRDVDLLRAQALAEISLGRWQDAVEHLRQTRSIDPRSAPNAIVLADALLWLRRYDEALATYDQALALSPSALNAVQGKAMTLLAKGDLAGARSVLAKPPTDIDLPSFVAYMAIYWDTYWALDEEQRSLVKRLTPTAFDGDAGTWGLALAGVYEVEGDMRRAAAYADSARVGFEQQLTATPEDPQRHVLLGVALAYMGRKEAAVREGLRGLSAMEGAPDAQNGTYFKHQLARIYILAGEQEKAVEQLESLLKIPYYLSPGWLSVDPTFDPLRKNPRFQKLALKPEEKT